MEGERDRGPCLNFSFREKNHGTWRIARNLTTCFLSPFMTPRSPELSYLVLTKFHDVQTCDETSWMHEFAELL